MDECHQIITCSDFRIKFIALKELAQFTVQKIYLTATLPPDLEKYFLRQTCLPDSTIIIRSQTNRPNLFHHVLHVDSEIHKNGKDLVVKLAALLDKDFLEPQSRGIIFCTTKEEVNELAPLFQNTKSHSDMDSDTRVQIQEEWFQGIGRRWMVATTGFIHGIDHPGVDAVIFKEMPYGLLNYDQGSGRAGRSRQPAHIFLLTFDNIQFIEPPHMEDDVSCRITGNEYRANLIQCRRRILSRTMDGVEVSCQDVFKSIGCDICKPHDPIVLASKRLLDAPHMESPEYQVDEWDSNTLQELDQMEDQLMQTSVSSALVNTTAHQAIILQQAAQASTSSATARSMALHMDHSHYMRLILDKKSKVEELTNMTKVLLDTSSVIDGMLFCPICWAWKGRLVKKTPKHSYFFSCKSKSDHFVSHAFGWIDQCKKILKIATFKYCHQCGLPQGDLMPSTHATFKRGETMRCVFDDLVAVLVWYIIHDENVLRKACEEFPALKEIRGAKAKVEWMTREDDPTKFYNGLEVVIWFWLTYKKGKN